MVDKKTTTKSKHLKVCTNTNNMNTCVSKSVFFFTFNVKFRTKCSVGANFITKFNKHVANDLKCTKKPVQ